MPNRKLLYPSKFQVTEHLSNNHLYMFSKNHALQIFLSKSIYTYIPKNMCSTLRASVAVANKVINFNEHDIQWIHSNNDAFVATLSDLINAQFTFVIIRNPYSRIVSFYLDAITKPQFTIDMQKTIPHFDLQKMSFTNFLDFISEDYLYYSDHWQPQSNFLVYEEYDLYIPMERFTEYQSLLEKESKIKIFDARQIINNTTGNYELIKDQDCSNLQPSDIINLNNQQLQPSLKSLFTPLLREKFESLFWEDLQLYKKLFKINPNHIMDE